MAELIEYARTLAEEIGPRPATTDSEHRAAEWLEKTFSARGLETEMQEFNSPHTYSWAFVLYHLLTMSAAFLAGFKPFLTWPAFAVSAIVAFFMWSDLGTHFGLTRLMPKGPSQNVIARHVPRARRGERLRKIVIVAHYDSARSSLAFAPNMVGGFATTFGLLKWSTFLTPVLVLVMALPFEWLAVLDPWLWYVTMVVAAYLLIPTIINIHRELFMPFVAGANDNASGVAAMLGVMEQIVPAVDANSLATGSFSPVRRSAEDAHQAGVVPQGAELRYSPAATPDRPDEMPEDFPWAEPMTERPRGQAVLEFDTIEFAAVDGRTSRPASRPAPVERPAAPAYTPRAGDVMLPADVAGPAPTDASDESKRTKRGLLSGFGRKRQRANDEVKEWLGVDEDFDARKAGKDIGSWDNFGEEDDDGVGWKGGWAGDDPIEDPEFAASEAARIRRRVTESVDRELTEKEVWFVATGAEEVGTLGMQALLRDYGEELRDAFIINIDGCGAGQLYWASSEGMTRRYRADRRLVGLARRVSRETDTLIKPREYRGLSTDASPALARGFHAMSIMAFAPSGMPVNWHWNTDTVDNLDPELIEKTAKFVTAMVREA
ncbi:MAG: hypothetical protein CVT67_03705 [Actinobacteria bacterium HGW-Actinobacteria-7]|jgi:hypothetical protein|nr:MAG: hypothetical protein CVT67_03705 [Actinobacteria bacterium HGW-Actinobacteria-7]